MIVAFAYSELFTEGVKMQLSGRALYDLAHPGLDLIEKTGISTSGSAVPQSGEKPKTDWEIPQTKKLKTLKSYLCDLGRTSNGLYCAACESQCAFGREYITRKHD